MTFFSVASLLLFLVAFGIPGRGRARHPGMRGLRQPHAGSWLVALATVPVLHRIVLVEEREVVDRFGQRYRDYMARTPRYLPRRAD